MNEHTPLLKSESSYSRFSQNQKSAILALLSFAALLALFTASSFVPAVRQVAADLSTTPDLVNLSVGIYLSIIALGSLLWSTYASYYGRRPIYLASLPIYVLASLGVVLSRSITHLILFRALQAFGSCSFTSVGASAIADIYDVEERGYAMGIFWGTALLAPALAPFLGGLISQFLSWRMTQACQGLVALFILLIIAIFLPETSQPGTRGVDRDRTKLELERLSNESAYEVGYLYSAKWKRWGIVWLNPFRPLLTLREPHLFAVCIVLSLQVMTEYALLVPLPYTIAKTYNITDSSFIGAIFIPAGIGNIIGAPLSGHLSDTLLKKYKSLRGGTCIPEDRLRVAYPGTALLVPLPIFAAGLAMTFLKGHEGENAWANPGLWICLACLFVNGVGIDSIFGPCIAYTADVTHHRSAEAIAASAAARHLLIALISATILPLINTIGILWAYLIVACCAWCGCGLLWVTIRYGGLWRERSKGHYEDRDTRREVQNPPVTIAITPPSEPHVRVTSNQNAA